MARFVHLTSERRAQRIARGGIRAHLTRVRATAQDPWIRGVYVMPVTPNFIVTHQWLRELRRRGVRTICGVYVRIPDDQPVWAGRYNEDHRQVMAAEAVALLMATESADGFEVVLPRSILRGEVQKIRHLPQVVGWRYYPEANGHPPYCGCDYCVGGQIKSRRLRLAYEQGRPPFGERTTR